MEIGILWGFVYASWESPTLTNPSFRAVFTRLSRSFTPFIGWFSKFPQSDDILKNRLLILQFFYYVLIVHALLNTTSTIPSRFYHQISCKSFKIHWFQIVGFRPCIATYRSNAWNSHPKIFVTCICSWHFVICKPFSRVDLRQPYVNGISDYGSKSFDLGSKKGLQRSINWGRFCWGRDHKTFCTGPTDGDSDGFVTRGSHLAGQHNWLNP